MFIQARGLTDDRVFFFLFKIPQRQPHFSRWISCFLQILFKVSRRGWWPSRCEKSRLYSLCCLSLALNVKHVGGASFDLFSLLYFLFRFVASTEMTRGSLRFFYYVNVLIPSYSLPLVLSRQIAQESHSSRILIFYATSE